MIKAKGAYAALGGPLYIKNYLGKAHYLIQASDSFFHEITPACFEATMKRSTLIDTAEVKKKLEAFNEHKNLEEIVPATGGTPHLEKPEIHEKQKESLH